MKKRIAILMVCLLVCAAAYTQTNTVVWLANAAGAKLWQGYKLVVASGGEIEAQSGGIVDFMAGSTVNLPAPLNIGGVSMTASAAELNTMDGITASTAEINQVDGLTLPQTSVSGNAGTVTTAVDDVDSTMWPLLGSTTTGAQSPETSTLLTYDSANGILISPVFAGTLNGNADTASTVGWGGLTGSISSQTDLQGELDGKLTTDTSSIQSGFFGDIFLKDDTSPSHYLLITSAENLTAPRTLSLVTGDAARTLTLGGNATLNGGTHSGVNTGDQDLSGKQNLDTQLTDLAGLSYAGNTLKNIRVNAGGTGWELYTPTGGGDVTGPGSSTTNAIARFVNTGGIAITDSGVNIDGDGELELSAGNTADAAVLFQEGNLQTTPADGSLEMDSDAFYGTTDAGNRGHIPVKHFIRADATRTFASNTNQQAIFTTPTNGRLTLETGVYQFEGLIAMTSMSGTSGNGKFSLLGAGSATLDAILWQAIGNDVVAEATAAATGGSWHVIATQTAVNITTAGAGTGICFVVKGTFEVTGAGTIVPSFAQTTAAAAIVSIGSYIEFSRVGSTTAKSVGQWD